MNKNLLSAGFYFEFDEEIKQSSNNKDIINRIMYLKDKYPDVQESLIKTQKYLTTERNAYQTRVLPRMNNIRSLLENVYDGNIRDMVIRYRLLNVEKIEQGSDDKILVKRIIDCLKISEELKILEPNIDNFVRDIIGLDFLSAEGKERIKDKISMLSSPSSTSFDIVSRSMYILLPLLQQMSEQSIITEDMKKNIRKDIKKDITDITSELRTVIENRDAKRGRELAKRLGMDIDKEEAQMIKMAGGLGFGLPNLGIYNNSQQYNEMSNILDKLLWDNLSKASYHISKNMNSIIEKESKAHIERAYSKQKYIKPKIEKLLDLGNIINELNKRIDDLDIRADVINYIKLRDTYCSYHNDRKCRKNCVLEKLDSRLSKIKYHMLLTVF